MGGRPKPTFEQVKQTFEERGCVLLETEYVNDRTPMRYIARCGHERMGNFGNFKRGKGDWCFSCRHAIAGKSKSIGEEAIRKAFEADGCEVLSVDGYTNRAKVRYIAQCGHENTTDYQHFVSQHGGRLCAKCSQSVRYGIEYVRECFEERGCTLLEDTYKNCKTKMRYIAQCGHESTITFDELLNSDHAALRCRNCHKHKYHEVIEDRNRTAYKRWREAIYERDGYACRVCGRSTAGLNAHHLYSYDDYPDKRFDLDNGITLCPRCHIRFHNWCGSQGCTAELFNEWLKGNTEVITGTKEPVTP